MDDTLKTRSEEELLASIAQLSQNKTGNSKKNRKEGDITKGQAKGSWLEPHWFKPGQSGNPSGRPKCKIETEALKGMGELPCPPKRKELLERALDLKLRNDLTMAQYAAIMAWQRAATDTDTLAWIVDRIEGPMKHELGLELTGGVDVNGPVELITQYVQLGEDGLPIRVLTVEGDHGNANNGNGASASAPEDSLPLPERV